MQAFGTEYLTKESGFLHHGLMVARMFAKGFQGRAHKARQLRGKVASIEQFGEQILTGPRLERARAASAHGKRGLSKAASVADIRYRTKSPPKKRSSTPPAKRITLKSRPRSPDRPVLTLVGKPGMTAPFPPLATAKRARQTTRSLVGKKAQQAASVVARAPSPSITPDERANLEMRAKASAGKRLSWLLQLHQCLLLQYRHYHQLPSLHCPRLRVQEVLAVRRKEAERLRYVAQWQQLQLL